MIVKKYKIMSLNGIPDREGNIIDKNSISNLPKDLPVFINFDEHSLVGKASNFVIEEEGILCDIVLDKDIDGFVVPGISIKSSRKNKINKTVKITKGKLISLGWTLFPMDSDLKTLKGK